MSEEQKTEIEPGLKLIAGGEEYVVRDGDILGRQGTIAKDFFERTPTVSREHVLISKRAGQWYITIPDWVANSTMLDGVEAPRGEPQLIIGERFLKMGGNCLVRLKA
jgi:hypothetical protein